MKLQRSTIILMFGALLMGGSFYYYETLIIPAQENQEAFTRKLFKFQKEDVQSLLVKTESQTLRFERASEISAPTDLWFMEILEIAEEPAATEKTAAETSTEEPAEETVTAEETETTEETSEETVTAEATATIEEMSEETVTAEETATNKEPTTEERKINPNIDIVPEKSSEKIYGNEAYVSFLIEQLVSQRSEQTLTVPTEKMKQYGLKPPGATIEITLKDGKIHQFIIGQSEFSGDYIYAQVNPPNIETPSQQVVVVSKNFEYAVDRTIEDWKQPAEEILEQNPE